MRSETLPVIWPTALFVQLDHDGVMLGFMAVG
jgi:hypothetical protein